MRTRKLWTSEDFHEQFKRVIQRGHDCASVTDWLCEARDALGAAEARIKELETERAERQCPECEGCQTQLDGTMHGPCTACLGTGLALGGTLKAAQETIAALIDGRRKAEARIKELEHRAEEYVHRSALEVAESRCLAAEQRIATLEAERRGEER